MGEPVSGIRYIAAGGGGGNYFSPVGNNGGLGGGGNGGYADNFATTHLPGENGLIHTGSGGGGGGYTLGGNGGSGLVTVRWPK
jgi:hypothetical protein